MHYDFIEIGTSDFDTLVEQDWPEDVRGICVEPSAAFLDSVLERPNVIKANVAIGSGNGIAPLYCVEEKDVPDYLLAQFKFRGACTLYNLHPFVLGCVAMDHIAEELIKEEIVQVVTWETFVNTYDVTSIGHLKIDAEGHDIIILRQYLDYCAKYPECLADKIEFEMQTYVWGELIREASERLAVLGYTELRMGRDDALFVKAQPACIQFGEFDLIVNN